MASITIDLPDTITIPLGRNSVYGTLDIDVERLPHNALEYIWNYGLKQVLNDAMATKVDKEGEPLSDSQVGQKAYEKLSALYEGTLRMRGEAVAADAYEAEAIREAKRHTIAVFTKAGLMKNIPKGTENRMMFALNRELRAKGVPEITEVTYLANFFTTKVGKAITERARKTVDQRRADAGDMEDILDSI
jgi:hypothetical protein